MPEAKKDLQYYLDHADEMPTDPKEIEALANAHMQQALETSGSELTIERYVKPVEEPKSQDKAQADAKAAEEQAVIDKAAADEAAAEDKAAEDKAAADKAAAEAEEAAKAKAAEQPKKPDGILAKDGKNVIPYSQLESARARTAEAERLIAEQKAEIERLKADKEPAPGAQPEILTEEDLAALEGDSPTLAKVLRYQQNTIAKLKETVQALTAHTQQRIAVEETGLKSELQKAIDGNEQLATWQTAEDQTMWNLASRWDKALREMPKYAEVSFADRFKRVVQLTLEEAEDDAAPATKEPPAAPPTKEQRERVEAQNRAAAEAKLKAKTSIPRSLSDIPGGAPPAVDERERVEQMSSVELGNRFMGMTKDQLDAYLASL